MTDDTFTELELALGMGLANAPPIEAYAEDEHGRPVKPPPDEDPPTRVRPVVRTNVHARPSGGSVPNRRVRTNEHDS